MKKLILLICIIFFTQSIHAQVQTLVLNYEKSVLGENQPLPANENFIISGTAPNDVPYVEIQIFGAKGKDDRTPIYTAFWKRAVGNNNQNFSIPINQKLREGKDYDVVVQYFRTITQAEKAILIERIESALDAYVGEVVQIDGNKLKLVEKEKQILNDLNTIVTHGLTNYRTRTAFRFVSFSDLIMIKLNQLNDTKIEKGSEKKTSGEYATVQKLQTMLHEELAQYMNNELYVMSDDKYIEDYPTTELQNYLPINIGYGGAVTDTDVNNFSYGSGMYLGLSFPFGKEGSDSKFWSKTSLSVGAFTTNLTNQDGDVFTGPIFGIPTYASLGYRAFRFVRVNAGATFLENTATSDLTIQPFIGVSAEFNLSFSIAK